MQFYDWVHTALVFKQIKVRYEGQVGDCFRNISETMLLSKGTLPASDKLLERAGLLPGGGGGGGGGAFSLPWLWLAPPLGYGENSIYM